MDTNPYVCQMCGAEVWCVSFDHTLIDCSPSCEHYTEDPWDSGAWCCTDCPAEDCNNGESCSESCACREG